MTELKKLNEESILEELRDEVVGKREIQSNRDGSNELKTIENLRANKQPKLKLARDRGYNLKRNTINIAGCQSVAIGNNDRGVDINIEPGR